MTLAYNRNKIIKKYFALTFLFGMVSLTALLWYSETNYFSEEIAPIERKNHTKKSIKENTQANHGILNKTKPWLIIFWSTYFKQQLNIQLAWKKGECPVACEVTSNRSRARDANGFIVHARDSHMMPPNDFESVPFILHTRENPVYTPALTNSSFMSKFKLLNSYHLDSDFPDPSFFMPAVAAPLPFKDKDGFIMAAFSNCEPVRTEYMRQLMKYVQVDSYGACLKNKKGLVQRYGSKKGEDFRDAKMELAKKYKFTLVFFNQDCDYFVDAQLSHALHAGSVPVVMGTDKLYEFLPGNLRQSVISVRDFKTPKTLAKYLKYLKSNETEYHKYLQWKWKGFGDLSGTVIGDFWMPKYTIYCQMCVTLSEGRIHKEGLKPITCKARRFEDWGITRRA